MFTEKIFSGENNVRNLFKGYGSFGEIKGALECDGNTVYNQTDDYRVECSYEKDECGVFLRKDTFTNKSQKDINIRSLKSRFVFEGGEYEVYTQFNNWQTEAIGAWQPLVTSVSATCDSYRSATNATPFMVLWNNQTNRGAAFHILPKSAWEMKVSRQRSISKHSKVVLDIGIVDYNFDVSLAPGESLEMPEIICYEIRNKLDMDCYKLHNYMHNKYPRKRMPVIYNTWLYKFDHISYESIVSQVKLAANLGVEYFCIDAGWFGKGAGWTDSVGDWEENTTSKLCGRMNEIADEVRKNGMKFGLWLEPERASVNSDSVKSHREYYMGSDMSDEICLLDFANEDAREWMLGVIDNLIERYGIEYIKDDCNEDMYFDPRGTAFLKYHEGHREFIEELRRRHPDIYLTNCGAGGHRLELKKYTEFDSSWPSDNEDPYEEMRIYKDTILRLPPQGMERWVVAHSLIGFESFYEPFKGNNRGNCERMVACADATWHNIIGVQQSFLEGYMTGGPVGFSCDLSKISEKATEDFKAYIKKFKENREFWKSAVARILCDTPSVTMYQYSDMPLSKVIVQVFTHRQLQQNFIVVPVLDDAKSYSVNGESAKSGKEIMEEGIIIRTENWIDSWREMFEIEITEV